MNRWPISLTFSHHCSLNWPLSVCCLSLFLFQGDRGETGPPGPAGFAGPPVSNNNNTDQHLALQRSKEHDSEGKKRNVRTCSLRPCGLVLGLDMLACWLRKLQKKYRFFYREKNVFYWRTSTTRTFLIICMFHISKKNHQILKILFISLWIFSDLYLNIYNNLS